ncbi:ribosomal protein S12 methylthiotransferase accessory factor [Streptomyces sp. Ag109_G2-6]|nr:ribosomal protein S12 methylthiotransferase accessory factor [Streptomyces sp. Ag109_G2-6]
MTGSGPLGPSAYPSWHRGRARRCRGPAVVLLERWTLGLAEELSRHALGHPVEWVPVRFDGPLAVVGPVLAPGRRPACAAPSTSAWPRRRPGALAEPGARAGRRTRPGPVRRPRLPGPGPAGRGGARPGGRGGRRARRPPGARHLVHPPRPSRRRLAPSATPSPPTPRPPRTRWPAAPRPLPGPVRAARPPIPPPPVPDSCGRRCTTNGSGRCAASSAPRTPPSPSRGAFVSDGRLVDDGGYGRAHDFATSERIALFEAVERYAGMRPTGRRTDLRAPLRRTRPRPGPGPRTARPARPRPPRAPGLAHRPLHARSGAGLGTGLVADPAPPGPRTRARGLLGTCPAPAAARGVRVLQRLRSRQQPRRGRALRPVRGRGARRLPDGWYAATPCAASNAPGRPGHGAPRGPGRRRGLRLLLLDATNDFGIPAVVAVCHYEGTHPDAPRMFLAAGAHHDPRAAIAPPWRRWSPTSWSRRAVLRRGRRTRPAAAAAHAGPAGAGGRPGRPRRVNALPQAAPRLAFLLADTPPCRSRRPGRRAPGTGRRPRRPAHATVDRLPRRSGGGHRSTRANRDCATGLGLHCVKVVVPGSLPMTFGHVNRRTRGLPRLLDVPHRLGRTPRPLRHEDLALHPHPFP